MKIAVIVPVYNGEEYLKSCLEAIKNQTYTNLQVIVCDNESTDNTWNIIKEYQDEFTVIKTKNIYQLSWDDSAEESFKLFDSDVEYFTLIAHDDLIDREYIANMVGLLKKSRAMGLQSAIKCFGASNQIIAYSNYPLEEYKDQLLVRCVVNTPSVFYKRELAEHWWAYPDKYAGASDYYRYLKFADMGIKILSYEKYTGYNYRVHKDQCTWGMHRNYAGVDKQIQEEFKRKWGKQ